MSFDDELNLLSSDSQSILAHQTITVWRIRPETEPDPMTFERTTVLDRDILASVPQDPTVSIDPQGRRVTRMSWIVRVEDTTFRPSPRGEVRIGEKVWRIVAVQDHLDGREYLIIAERIA